MGHGVGGDAGDRVLLPGLVPLGALETLLVLLSARAVLHFVQQRELGLVR